MRIHCLAALAIALAAAAAQAQDAVQVAPAHYAVKLENEHVRVIENTLKPGEKDGMHTHPSGWYYVTQPGTMKVVHQGGKSELWKAKAGEAGWLKAEGPHTSENVGEASMSWVLVEVKGAPAEAADARALKAVTPPDAARPAAPRR